jgi:hypothetical protein
VIDKTNTVQEKTDLTGSFLGDKVHQALGISWEITSPRIFLKNT